jgi:hypothetical protein
MRITHENGLIPYSGGVFRYLLDNFLMSVPNQDNKTPSHVFSREGDQSTILIIYSNERHYPCESLLTIPCCQA